MSEPGSNTQTILHMRIGFALRRFTGVTYDVEAMLARPDLRARRLALWRKAGCSELNELLDELEGRGRRAPARPAQGAHAAS
jgi:hypothetical protein